MSLTWNAVSAPDLAGYRVFRGTSLPVATTGNGLGGAALLTGTSFTDLTAVNGTAYQYVVVSVDTTGNRSAASTAASVTPSVAAGAAVDLDGTNDYVTFGAARRPGRDQLHARDLVPARRRGRRRDHRHRRHHQRPPARDQGRAGEGETTEQHQRQLVPGHRCHDRRPGGRLRGAATGANHPVSGTRRRDQQRLAPRRSHLQRHHRHLEALSRRRPRSHARARRAPSSPTRRSIQHAALGIVARLPPASPAGFFNGALDEAASGTSPAATPRSRPTSTRPSPAAAGSSPATASTRAPARRLPRASPAHPPARSADGPLWTAGPPLTPGGNSAPVFSTEFTDRTDAEGDVISLDANATDADLGTRSPTRATNLPAGVSINARHAASSAARSAPPARAATTSSITVTDGTLTDTDSFTWTVDQPQPGPGLQHRVRRPHRRRGRRRSASTPTPPMPMPATRSPTAPPACPTASRSTRARASSAARCQRDQLGHATRRHHRQRRQRSPTPTPSPGRSPTPTRPPVFSTDITDRTDAEGDPVSLDANATDADPATRSTYTATNLPDGITINSRPASSAAR